MLRFTKIILVLCLAALTLTACGPKLTLGKADAGKTLELKTGDTFTVALEGNPTTGFNWDLGDQVLKTVQLVGEPEYKADSNLIGSAGVITLKFKAVAAGQETVKLLYHRSWETGVEPLETFEFNVSVK